MGRGLMQLVAYAPQNLYLTGNPQASFFTSVYTRHTNFAMEYIQLTYEKAVNMDATKRTKTSCKILRNADLIHDTHLVFDAPALYSNTDEPVSWIDKLGDYLIYYYDITIGGQIIDRRYGQWLSVWNELTLTAEQKQTNNKNIGNTFRMKNPKVYSATDVMVTPSNQLIIPLDLWFCTNPGLALPLISLQYTDIYINIEFSPLNDLFRLGSPLVSPKYLYSDSDDLSAFNKTLVANLKSEGYDLNNLFLKYATNFTGNSYLLGNYIFLDEDERRRFSATSHEYLVTTIQRNSFSGLKEGPNTLDISNMNNPVKELVWVLQRDDVENYNEWDNFTIQNQIENLYYLINKNRYRYLQLNEDPEITDIDASSNVQDYIEALRDEYIPANSSPEYINSTFPDFVNIMKEAVLLYWGNESQAPYSYKFYNSLMPSKYHTGSPKDGIYVRPYSLKPESEKPAGVCNYSAINRIHLKVDIYEQDDKSARYDAYVYAPTFNVLRIAGGIGELAWAN